MLEPEKLDYFKWQIPDGSRVRLTLLQENDEQKVTVSLERLFLQGVY
ncbi:hypothetical protein [Leptolyngbya sp. Cla-17]|nr:hypothetical protein [Leptolyngbya sp. Cla-17]